MFSFLQLRGDWPALNQEATRKKDPQQFPAELGAVLETGTGGGMGRWYIHIL